MVRSNSAAASAVFLQISHINTWVIESRISLSSSTSWKIRELLQARTINKIIISDFTFSMLWIRSIVFICGQTPRPVSHAAFAASAASTASLSPIIANLPMTIRLPFSSRIGDVVSVHGPDQLRTSPLIKQYAPLTKGRWLNSVPVEDIDMMMGKKL